MDKWVVASGELCSIRDAVEDVHGFRLVGMDGWRLWRDEYGFDWLVVEADNAAEPLAAAVPYDERRHLAQVDMELFAVAYHGGAVPCLQSADVLS
jgi:hypothetical protein